MKSTDRDALNRQVNKTCDECFGGGGALHDDAFSKYFPQGNRPSYLFQMRIPTMNASASLLGYVAQVATLVKGKDST